MHSNQSGPNGEQRRSDSEFSDQFNQICDNVERAIRGKRSVVELVVMALLSDGHVLLEDAPGVGKTTLAKSLARSISVTFGRLQFTPDLLPADVVGVNIWNRNTAGFEFRAGPVFSNIVLADEINRASPKTQSALLEAMAERQVTVDGDTKHLSSPFMVIATQNPFEYEGTYPLPESQLDRFLLKTTIGYPDGATEVEILEQHGIDEPADSLTPVIDAEGLDRLRSTIDQVHVAEALRQYLVSIAAATRAHPALALGASPRALLSLQRLCQTHAASVGRNYATPDDVQLLAPAALPHRLVITPEARARGVDSKTALDEVLRSVPVPSPA